MAVQGQTVYAVAGCKVVAFDLRSQRVLERGGCVAVEGAEEVNGVGVGPLGVYTVDDSGQVRGGGELLY
jgi:hypothetical protein